MCGNMEQRYEPYPGSSICLSFNMELWNFLPPSLLVILLSFQKQHVHLVTSTYRGQTYMQALDWRLRQAARSMNPLSSPPGFTVWIKPPLLGQYPSQITWYCIFNLNIFLSPLDCELCHPNKLEKYELGSKRHNLIVKIRSDYGKSSESMDEQKTHWTSVNDRSLGLQVNQEGPQVPLPFISLWP